MQNSKNKAVLDIRHAQNALQSAQHPLRIIIAGGGTGGHLFPGIAIAESFIAKDPDNKILFVGTDRPFEISVLTKTGFNHKKITAEGFKGRRIWNKAKSILKIPKGVVEAIRIHKSFKSDLVVGMGGYSSGPLVLGAWFCGVKTVLHEQNMMAGMTNRILARFADQIYVSFEKTENMFDPKKVRVTGNPIRREILADIGETEDSNIKSAIQKHCFTILIIGGSQGAHKINMAIIDSLKHLKEKQNYLFNHQTGALDEKIVMDAYARFGIACTVRAFFNDMDRQYRQADLIICRSGATTVAEVAVRGKGAIFVPYPFATDDHQSLNAKALKEADAAEIIMENDLSGEILAGRIEYYNSNTDMLEQMAAKAKAHGKPEAAKHVVEECYELLGMA